MTCEYEAFGVKTKQYILLSCFTITIKTYCRQLLSIYVLKQHILVSYKARSPCCDLVFHKLNASKLDTLR